MSTPIGNPKPSTNPKRRPLYYWEAERYGRWLSIVLLIAAVWLIGSCISATSGRAIPCDAENVAVAGCANP